MDQFLLNIEKYKYSILGTILIHIAIIVSSSFTQIQNVMKMPPQEVSIDLPLENIEFEPEIEEILELNKEPIPSQEITNVAADANDTREESFENYSTNMDESTEEVEKTIKELEAEYFKDAAAKNTKNNATQNDSYVPIETKADKIKTNGSASNITKGGDKAFAGEVMISYSLKDRKAFSLPNPGYTCSSNGTIVIEIKVDGSGSVKSTRFLSAVSSGATECLIESATKYAARSRFNSSSGGNQTGTITYKFRGQ
ncbi:MAG: hypothetical protein AB8B74_10655 [Crocinitomicaceae bacterium]